MLRMPLTVGVSESGGVITVASLRCVAVLTWYWLAFVVGCGGVNMAESQQKGIAALTRLGNTHDKDAAWWA